MMMMTMILMTVIIIIIIVIIIVIVHIPRPNNNITRKSSNNRSIWRQYGAGVRVLALRSGDPSDPGSRWLNLSAALVNSYM